MAIALDPAMSPGDVTLALHILEHVNKEAGYAYLSQATLARLTRETPRNIRRRTARLAAAGYFTVRESLGRGHAVTYQPIYEKRTPESAFTSQKEDRQVRLFDDKSGLPSPEKRTPESAQPSYESSKDISLKFFDEFWAAYPRKVSKGTAINAWRRAIKLAPTSTIIAAAQGYAAERAGEDPKYTKHPATWLNAQAWLDQTVNQPPADRAPEGVDPVAWFAKQLETDQ